MAVVVLIGRPHVNAQDSEPPKLSDTAQIRALLKSSSRHVEDVQLAGTVLSVDPIHQAFIFRDETGCMWFEAESLPTNLLAGAHLEIKGKALIGDGTAFLGFAPLMNRPRALSAAWGTSQIFLQAGKYRFDLKYAQETGPAILNLGFRQVDSNSTNVDLAGITRATIPSSILLHSDANAPGQVSQGIEFKYYEGAWPGFPNFETLTPVAAGITTNFNLAMAQRTNNYAVRFSGWLNLPQSGKYDLGMRADEHGEFTLFYDSRTEIKVTGHDALPAAVRLLPGQSWNDLPEPCWAEVEGTVRQVGTSKGKLQLELSAETGRMQVLISNGDEEAAAMLLNSRIRIKGLCWSGTTPSGTKAADWLLAPNMDRVLWQAAETLWLSHPVILISNLPAILNASGDKIVHVRGTVTEVEAAHALTIVDESGKPIQVNTARAAIEDNGTIVDALGLLRQRGNGDLALDAAAYRQGEEVRPAERNLPLLTTIEQVRRLKPDEAARQYPVKIRGVVTFVFYGGVRAHVQGDSEGIYVSCNNKNPQPLKIGDLCEFEGISSRGAFSPVVTYRTRTILGSGQLPEPLHPTWSELINGGLDSQWVEIQGVVLRVQGGDLTLAMRGGEVAVHLVDESETDLARFKDAVIRVRGTVRGYSQRQSQRAVIQINSAAQITVEEAAPADVFSIPARSVAELFLFDPNAASFHRVKTVGQIVHVRDGIGYLLDGTNGMRIAPRSGDRFVPGDLVAAVGFPEIESSLPVMRQAQVRVLGHSPLPDVQLVSANDLLTGIADSTLIQVQATLVNVRTNASDYVLELQSGEHTFIARLDRNSGALQPVPIGSRIQLTGLYATQTLASRNNSQQFELLLNTPSDLVVLQTPSWWNTRHALNVIGVLTLVLLVSVMWITALRRRVERRTRELRAEIETRKVAEVHLENRTGQLEKEIQERIQVQQELEEKKTRLEKEIEERKRIEMEVEHIHRQLMHASRQAGQAEVASSVLHNVGNVLNSVNVSTSLLRDGLRDWRLASVSKVAGLVRDRVSNLNLQKEDQLSRLPEYLENLKSHLEDHRAGLLAEVKDLTENVDHIKEIVAMQQTYARISGVSEKTTVPDLVEGAVKMHTNAYARHEIQLIREFAPVPEVTVDRHKILQILVNLLHNAKHACCESGKSEKQVVIRIQPIATDRVKIEVTDNGVGISPEVMARLFSHGFTTRKDGHGFGLHSAALAAKELGGELSAQSDGAGCGATFTLEMPIAPKLATAEASA
jgi:signal transduction histidine kinase